MVKSGIINKEKLTGVHERKAFGGASGEEIQYASMYDPETLDEVENAGKEALLAVSVKIGGTRLIDNMLVKA